MLKPRPWWLWWLSETTWMTIDESIYHPRNIDPTKFPWLVAHEEVHVKQQEEIGWVIWIYKWLTDKNFRLTQEAAGIAKELSISGQSPDWYIEQLCGPMYRYAASSPDEARNAIAEATKLL